MCRSGQGGLGKLDGRQDERYGVMGGDFGERAAVLLSFLEMDDVVLMCAVVGCD